MKGQTLRIEVAYGPDAGLIVDSDNDEITLGTDPSSTVVLHDPLVAPLHLTFSHSNEGFILRDKSGRDDVNVDGQPAREARLASFTFIELGGTTLRLEKMGGGYVSAKNAKVLVPADRTPGLRFPDVSTLIAQLPESLSGSAKLLLNDDLLLVIGGEQPMEREKSKQVALVDLRTCQVHALPPLPEPRSYAMATKLVDGRVLVTGGGTTSTLILDPQTWSWSASGPLGVVRNGGVLLPLTDGRVFAAGGFYKAEARASGELWDPTRNAWTPMPPGKSHIMANAVLLSPQRALLLSRANHKETPVAYLVNLEKFSMTTLAPLPEGLGNIVLVALPGERAMLLPSDGGDSPRRTAYFLDPRVNSGYFIPPRRFFRIAGTAVARSDGSVVVMSGDSSSVGLYTAEMYDPSTNSWRALPPPRNGPGGAKLFARSDGSLVVCGFQDVRVFPATAF